uniref:Uncharacterized protein n=1 Tax=Moniliophthora roreri TaxID=221103 RepID=A0A0W0G237_MONRR
MSIQKIWNFQILRIKK